MVLYGVLFLHLLVCISTVYGQCFTEYHSEMACVVPYGVPMHGTFSRSLMDCARACSINDSCASVILVEGTNTCFLNEQIHTEITVLCPNPQQYAQKTGNVQCGTTTNGTTTNGNTTYVGPPSEFSYMVYPYFFMSEPCTIIDECSHITNSECRDSICQCILGYSYDWTTQGCIAECTAYGNSYQKQLDTTSQYDILLNNLSEYKCLVECTNHQAFTCKSLIYDVIGLGCYLSSRTALVKSTSILAGFHMYHRDCLFV
ncbi:uncharacterized protein LOC132742033 [Ruditapes philippinarum]|uniref:uncharacterized protein LOC132742033 n=1 Tax=Ruditapes philippinarum TaxID=129788 RepID=UPI00295BA405|nr:uncharacterized protein LOC132742033 [Ruditapes philippinarum]